MSPWMVVEILCLLLLQFSSSIVAQMPTPSLVPPSTFGSGTVTSPVSPSVTASSVSTSGNSTSATPTSSAAFPSLSGYSPCVTNCLALGSAAANCTSVVDVNCFCNSSRFTAELVSCTFGQCPGELGTAENLAQQFCALAQNSTSLSFPTPSSLPSSTSPPTSAALTSVLSSSSASPSTSSNAAVAARTSCLVYSDISTIVVGLFLASVFT